MKAIATQRIFNHKTEKFIEVGEEFDEDKKFVDSLLEIHACVKPGTVLTEAGTVVDATTAAEITPTP